MSGEGCKDKKQTERVNARDIPVNAFRTILLWPLALELAAPLPGSAPDPNAYDNAVRDQTRALCRDARWGAH